jgi:hypothetical protein
MNNMNNMNNNESNKEHISILLNEPEPNPILNSNTEMMSTNNLTELWKEIDDVELKTNIESFSNEDNNMVAHFFNYYINYTVKQLLVISDYYGISKEYKLTKMKKEEIIYHVLFFESKPENQDIVYTRQNMWFYMNELKKDKFMKKFVLW